MKYLYQVFKKKYFNILTPNTDQNFSRLVTAEIDIFECETIVP